MKVMTVLGTRPEIIRLSRVIALLDARCRHLLVHTGQNSDPRLRDVFFAELRVRRPDHCLQAEEKSFARQVAALLGQVDDLLAAERPDRLLILGDTNSGLSALPAKRRGIRVFHMEAGNRCYDDRVPEELNRRVIDHASDVLMPYTERSRQNLLREGIGPERIFVTGNPILEVIRRYEPRIAKSRVHKKLGLKRKQYFLATLHRAENVDSKPRLESLLEGLDLIQKKYHLPFILSLHPRTRQKIEKYSLKPCNPDFRFVDPPGFFDFIALERGARCVLSDSGTVQEECCILRVPNVILRDVTERPEAIECGSGVLAGSAPGSILRCVRQALATRPRWQPPAEYLREHVADRACRIILGRVAPRRDRSRSC